MLSKLIQLQPYLPTVSSTYVDTNVSWYHQMLQHTCDSLTHRTILDNFGHLSAQDLSILKMYPLHRVGKLLGADQQGSSTVLSEALARLRDEEASRTSAGEERLEGDKQQEEDVCQRDESLVAGGDGVVSMETEVDDTRREQVLSPEKSDDRGEVNMEEAKTEDNEVRIS